MPLVEIAGYCPACGMQELHVNPYGVGAIRCLNPKCPDQAAARKILSDSEIHHILVVGEGTWTLKHPLRERIDDALLTCQLTELVGILMADETITERPEGRFRVILDGNEFTITNLFEPEVKS